MKIAFITHLFPPSIGGMQKWNEQMAQAYSLAGHTVSIFHFRTGKIEFSSQFFAYYPINIDPLIDPQTCPAQKNSLRSIASTCFHFFRLLPQLLQFEIWQLTIGEPLLLKLLAMTFAVTLRHQVITASGCVTFNHPFRPGFERWIKHLLLRWILNNSRLVLVDGYDLSRELSEHGINPRTIVVCHAGIDTELFRPVENRRTLNDFLQTRSLHLDISKPLILYCSRLAEENAPLDFIRSVAGFEGPEVLVIGDGPLYRSMVKCARDLNVHASFCGSVPFEMLPHFFSAAAICIYTYSKKIGGISQIIPLSMACGAVVITTLVGDNTALIDAGVNGFLVKPGNVSAVRSLIQKILTEQVDIKSIRNSAISTIVTNWSLSARQRMYEDLIAATFEQGSNNRNDPQ